MSDKAKHKKPKHQQQREDVDFLHEGFDVQNPKAAGLVTEDDEDADRLTREANERQLKKDELEGVPVPKAASNDLTQDADEKKLKPLVRNRRT